ncbi:Uncharacterised protein [Starkeya nomas]|uniref:Uncharacterized protein n=1 Tax=Starkeya nomas TaxID=2666134 RepID=A0A5S9N9W7_9HYPH|nr:hypothetical protein [Starkeya nomas]CAA0086909.1 Uncharacterised protein [Starkeya nomas]
MSQQSFIWRGPAQAVTLHDAAGAVAWEGSLVPGREATGLPPDHPFVVGWIDQKLLVAADIEAAGETGQRRKRGQQES